MLIDGLNAFTYNPSTDTIVGANLTGTSSWATNAITASTASFANTSSFLTQNRTYNITSSWAVTASNAISASWAPGATSVIFSRGGTFYDPYGLSGNGAFSQSVIIWRAPFVCTATAIYGYQVANTLSTTSSLTAWHNGATMLTAPIAVTASNVWVAHSASALISTSFAIGDRLQITLLTCSFGTTQSAVQIDFTRP